MFSGRDTLFPSSSSSTVPDLRAAKRPDSPSDKSGSARSEYAEIYPRFVGRQPIPADSSSKLTPMMENENLRQGLMRYVCNRSKQLCVERTDNNLFGAGIRALAPANNNSVYDVLAKRASVCAGSRESRSAELY